MIESKLSLLYERFQVSILDEIHRKSQRPESQGQLSGLALTQKRTPSCELKYMLMRMSVSTP